MEDKKTKEKVPPPTDTCNKCGCLFYDILGIGKCYECFSALTPTHSNQSIKQ